MDLLTFQIKVREGGTDWGWGVVVNVVKKPSGGGYIVDTLLHCSPVSNENSLRPKPCPPRPGEKGEMHVVSSHYKLLCGFFFIAFCCNFLYLKNLCCFLLPASFCNRFLFNYH